MGKMEHLGLVRRLPFHGGGRRPLLYIRPGCVQSPPSFRGTLVDAVIRGLLPMLVDPEFSWWKTGRIRQIDLLAEGRLESVGFCFSSNLNTLNRDWWPLRLALRRGLIQRGFLLHPGERAFFASAKVFALPAAEFVADLRAWILGRESNCVAIRAMDRINDRSVRRYWKRAPLLCSSHHTRQKNCANQKKPTIHSRDAISQRVSPWSLPSPIACKCHIPAAAQPA